MNLLEPAIDHDSIPIQRIISVACRNFMAFDGLHTFEFNDGVNTIIGGNASGKSSLVTLISQVLSRRISSPWEGRWHANYSPGESLIEMKFIAGDKEHYLRRVMLGDTTTDLHLYVTEGKERTFYRDGEVIDYFKRLKKMTTINGFEDSRKDFYFWTSGKTTNVNPLFSKSKELLEGINRFLPLTKSGVRGLRMVGNDVMVEYQNGALRNLSSLASGDAKIIFVIAKIFNLARQIEDGNLSKVILLDEIEIGLDKAKLDGLYNIVEALAHEYECQFMITSRFVNGRLNPIRINKAKIPRCYTQDTGRNMSKMIKNFLKTKPGIISKNPPFSKNSNTKYSLKWGSFKWNP